MRNKEISKRPLLLSILSRMIIAGSIISAIDFSRIKINDNLFYYYWILDIIVVIIGFGLLELKSWARKVILFLLPISLIIWLLLVSMNKSIKEFSNLLLVVLVLLFVIFYILPWLYFFFNTTIKQIFNYEESKKQNIIPRRKWVGALYLVLSLPFLLALFVAIADSFKIGWGGLTQHFKVTYAPIASLISLSCLLGVEFNFIKRQPKKEKETHFFKALRTKRKVAIMRIFPRSMGPITGLIAGSIGGVGLVMLILTLARVVGFVPIEMFFSGLGRKIIAIFELSGVVIGGIYGTFVGIRNDRLFQCLRCGSKKVRHEKRDKMLPNKCKKCGNEWYLEKE